MTPTQLPQTERVCACPCKRTLEGRRKSAKYFSAACRTAAWKDRRGITGIRYVKASQNAKKRSGVQISFHKAHAAATGIACEARKQPDRPIEDIVEDWLLPAVPKRQRAQVERERAA